MKYYEFKNISTKKASLYIYGDIGDGYFSAESITAKQFSDELKNINDANLDIYINSGGGSVFEGMAIYSQLKRFSGTKTVYIDGIAASIASVIAMAGDKIIMPDNTMMMIHRVNGAASGTADDFMKQAVSLEKIENNIIDIYSERTGQDKELIKNMMEQETWMSAEEAISLGFADNKTDAINFKSCISEGCSKVFKNIPNLLINKEDVKVAEDIINIIETENPTATLAVNSVTAVDNKMLSAEISNRASDILNKCIKAGFPQVASALIKSQATDEQIQNRLQESSEIKSACSLAKMPETIDDFLNSEKNIQEVRSDLFQELVTRDAAAPVSNIQNQSVDSSAPLQQRCKIQWDANQALRKEFRDDFDSYIAYMRAFDNKQIHLYQNTRKD